MSDNEYIYSYWATGGEDEVAVGDLNSDAKGSGARKNAGKPQLDLIPVRFWRECWRNNMKQDSELAVILRSLQDWQEGDTEEIHYVFNYITPGAMADAVKVLEFGAQKYKAWNWAKGMDWSVPTGCILRHARKIVEGEEIDGESHLPHMGHIVANVIMLAWYATYYQEGDDRPPV